MKEILTSTEKKQELLDMFSKLLAEVGPQETQRIMWERAEKNPQLMIDLATYGFDIARALQQSKAAVKN